MDEHGDQIQNTPDIRPTRGISIAERVPVMPIPIGRVNLSGLLSSNSPRIKEWETDLNIHLNVSAYPAISLFNQSIKPNREGKFMPYQEKAIANGRPEDAWSVTLMTAVSHALHIAMPDSEGILSGRRAPQIGITSDIADDKLIIEVKDNGQGIPKKIAAKLSPGYLLKEEENEENELPDIKVGNRLRYIYQAIEQIGGRSEIVTKGSEDLKPGETSGTTIRFTFSLNTP